MCIRLFACVRRSVQMGVTMKYRRLGRTGLSVSEVGFGTIPVLRGSVPVLPDYYNLSDEEEIGRAHV